MKSTLRLSRKALKKSITTNNTIYDQKFEVQAGIDATQDARIDRNSQAVDQLGYKVGELSKELSGGIAAASAIAFMPATCCQVSVWLVVVLLHTTVNHQLRLVLLQQLDSG